MFIQTEQTPNPATLKFLPGCEVLTSGTIDFTNRKEAEKSSPLAIQIFTVDGVVSVFLGKDFVTVTKEKSMEWSELKPLILSIVMDHFTAGHPVLFEEIEIKEPVEHAVSDLASDLASDLDSEIVTQIKEILDAHVRPAVARDGGDVIFDSYDNGIVYLRMQGACSGCPSAAMTLKLGVQNVLQHFIPEITDVRAVE